MDFIDTNKPTLRLEEENDLQVEKKCEKLCCLLFAEAAAWCNMCLWFWTLSPPIAQFAAKL